MNGKITYRLYQIKKKNIEDDCKFNHDEALAVTSRWFHNSTIDENIAVVSNYPWVYKNKSEIMDSIDEYKIIVIPPLSKFGRMSLPKFRLAILNDKFARLNEILRLVHADHDLHKLVKNAVCRNETNDCNNIYNCILEHSNAYTRSDGDNYSRTVSSMSAAAATTSPATTKLIKICNDPVLMHIPNPSLYKSTDEWVTQQVNANVHCLKDFRSVPMKGNIKFISMLQGRKSIIRNTISKKVKAFRCQIVLRPELKPNEIILPYIWADTLNVTPRMLVDVSTPSLSPPECFHHMKHETRLLVKRDPAINGASISAHDTVAFARTDNIYVGMSELEQKNADFDGDTESAFIVTNRRAIDEIDLNMIPQNNMRIFQQVRISFTEPHILYMHQRKIKNDAFRHAVLYKYIRRREIYRWLSQQQNREMIDKLSARHSTIEFYRYVEPTRLILRQTLNAITQMYSSRDAYDFYNFINENIIHLANGDKTSSIYDSNLPSDYYMETDLMCSSIIRVCFSGAKGSLDNLYSLAEKLMVNDNTTSIMSMNIAKLDKQNMFKQLTSVNQSMANKSREVQVNGHNFFKSNIGYDTISFDGGVLNYNGKEISNNLSFIHHTLLLPPDIANYITFIL